MDLDDRKKKNEFERANLSVPLSIENDFEGWIGLHSMRRSPYSERLTPTQIELRWEVKACAQSSIEGSLDSAASHFDILIGGVGDGDKFSSKVNITE